MEYIDLGLPSGNLWADCNVGTEDYRESGKYYSYDEALKLQTKEELLPSKQDFQELIDHCKWEWKELTHCNGYHITGSNGNSIFLSASGYCIDSFRYRVGEYGYYRSFTLNKSHDNNAYSLFFHDCGYNMHWYDYCFKNTIRLIKKKNNMEKRKIEIDINTAKEWYNSNNESLKAVALQAFTKEELKNSLPKTWEEWALENMGKGIYYINTSAGFQHGILLSEPSGYENSLNTRKDCEAHLALMQLHVLRDAYRDSYEKGWKPDVKNSDQYKWNIAFTNIGFELYDSCNITKFLSFPTRKLAEEFLKNFKELIEKAKDLI